MYSKTSQPLSRGGGIGRRARLKLVYLGVWVRFPPAVQSLSAMGGFFIHHTSQQNFLLRIELPIFEPNKLMTYEHNH